MLVPRSPELGARRWSTAGFRRCPKPFAPEIGSFDLFSDVWYVFPATPQGGRLG